MKKRIQIALYTFLLGVTLFAVSGCSKKSTTSSSVAKVTVGMSQERVKKILGNTTRIENENWLYYDKAILNKENEMKSLLESENMEDKQKANQILKELSSKEYPFIVVKFNENNLVEQVFVDKKHQYDPNNLYATVQKEIKKVNLSITTIPYYEDYSDVQNTSKVLMAALNHVAYNANFEDGSYFNGYLSEVSVTIDHAHATIIWSDVVSSYNVSKNLEKIGEIDADGKLLSWTQKGNVSVPSEIEEITEEFFRGRNYITSIFIPKEVKKIGKNAFKDCVNLKTVYYDGTVASWIKIDFENEYANPMRNNANFYIKNQIVSEVTIGDDIEKLGYAFSGCHSIQSVVISKNVKQIIANAFINANRINSVYYKGTLEEWFDLTFENEYANPMSNGVNPNLYIGENLLTDMIIPASISKINDYAFAGCFSLTSVTFENNSSLVSIGKNAFKKCKSLISFEIPSSIEKMNSGVFNQCSSLKYHQVDNINYLGNSENPTLVLVGLANKTIPSVTINENTKIVLDGAFENSTLQTINFENNSMIKVINEKVFNNCNSLKEILIPSGIQEIKDSAFSGCTSLENVRFADDSKLINIGNMAFLHCSNLEQMILPNSVVSIGDNAFAYCESLSNIQLSMNLKSIGNVAFSWCNHLESIVLAASVDTIGEYAFYQCSQLTIYSHTLNPLDNWHVNWNISNCPIYFAGQWEYVDNIPTLIV